MDLIVRVTEIKGRCPVYQVGDTFRLEGGFRLVADRPLCMHSLASLMPHYNALRISPVRGDLQEPKTPPRRISSAWTPSPTLAGGRSSSR